MATTSTLWGPFSVLNVLGANLECSGCGITHSSSFHSLTFDFSEYPLTYLHIAFSSERMRHRKQYTQFNSYASISEGVFRNLADFCLSDRI